MQEIIELIIKAGHAALDIALYTLLPIMIVMMTAMRVLEQKGVVDAIVRILAPIAKPFGLSGLGVLAAIQTTFVSFIAPLPTLVLMHDRGESNRRLAAAAAVIFAMAPANATFPLVSFGLHVGHVLIGSVVGGLFAATMAYWVFGRHLSAEQEASKHIEKGTRKSENVFKLVNASGAEAIQMILRLIPLLTVSLLIVFALEYVGFVRVLNWLLIPPMKYFCLDPTYILPTITKYLAGVTAVVGLFGDMHKQGILSPDFLNNGGPLLNGLDVPGFAVIISAGPRVVRGCVPAVLGGLSGILLRCFL